MTQEQLMRRALLLKAQLDMPAGQTNRIEIDGTIVGTVAQTVPSRSVITTDEAALIEWADRLYPDEVEVITQIRPAFRATWTIVGEHVLTTKGDIVEGVAVGTGSSSASVRPDKAQTELLWAAVRAEVPQLLAGGDDD